MLYGGKGYLGVLFEMRGVEEGGFVFLVEWVKGDLFYIEFGVGGVGIGGKGFG